MSSNHGYPRPIIRSLELLEPQNGSNSSKFKRLQFLEIQEEWSNNLVKRGHHLSSGSFSKSEMLRAPCSTPSSPGPGSDSSWVVSARRTRSAINRMLAAPRAPWPGYPPERLTQGNRIESDPDMSGLWAGRVQMQAPMRYYLFRSMPRLSRWMPRSRLAPTLSCTFGGSAQSLRRERPVQQKR